MESSTAKPTSPDGPGVDLLGDCMPGMYGRDPLVRHELRHDVTQLLLEHVRTAPLCQAKMSQPPRTCRTLKIELRSTLFVSDLQATRLNDGSTVQPTDVPRFIQYCGVSDATAGIIASVMLFCASWGALLGGYISDALTKPPGLTVMFLGFAPRKPTRSLKGSFQHFGTRSSEKFKALHQKML